MSDFSSELWFAWWLSTARGRLSQEHRENLHAVSIVHPSWGVRLLCATGRVVFGASFWNSLHYADRVEELWLDGIIDEDKARAAIPAGCMTYEEVLIADARETRERAIMVGAPLTRDESITDEAAEQ